MSLNRKRFNNPHREPAQLGQMILPQSYREPWGEDEKRVVDIVDDVLFRMRYGVAKDEDDD